MTYPQIAMRMPAVKPLHDTRPLLEIMQGLTKAMKIDDLYPFTSGRRDQRGNRPAGN